MRALTLSFIFVAFCLITSCYPTTPKYTTYVPNTLHTPLLKYKNDYNVTACASPIGGCQLQAAYSPLNHILVFANGMNNLLLNKYDSADTHSINYVAGIGWYHTISKRNLKDHQLNIIGGYGKGYCWDHFTVWDSYHSHLSSYSENYTQHISSSYTQYIIQPSYDIISDNKTTSYSLKLTSTYINLHAGMPILSSNAYSGTYYFFNQPPQRGDNRHIFNSVELAVSQQARYRYGSFYIQYKIFIPNTYVYNLLVTQYGTQFAQTVLGFTLGATINSDNINNMLGLHNHSNKATVF